MLVVITVGDCICGGEENWEFSLSPTTVTPAMLHNRLNTSTLQTSKLNLENRILQDFSIRVVINLFLCCLVLDLRNLTENIPDCLTVKRKHRYFIQKLTT